MQFFDQNYGRKIGKSKNEVVGIFEQKFFERLGVFWGCSGAVLVSSGLEVGFFSGFFEILGFFDNFQDFAVLMGEFSGFLQNPGFLGFLGFWGGSGLKSLFVENAK